MNIDQEDFQVVALSPNSWGSSRLVSKAVKHARLKVNWKQVNPRLDNVIISVYLCHKDTHVDTSSGGLRFPKDQRPILIDEITVHRPLKDKRKLKSVSKLLKECEPENLPAHLKPQSD